MMFISLGMMVIGGAYAMKKQPIFSLGFMKRKAMAHKYAYDYQRYAGASKSSSLKTALPTNKTPEAQASVTEKAPGSVPVLLYHRISNDNTAFAVSVNEFKDQMFALKKAGYQAISIYQYEAFRNGQTKLPPKSVLITFDDGAKDSYYPVDPILQALGFQATMYVITEHSLHHSDSTYYLSSEELLHMSTSGRWNIQAHTRDGHGMVATDSQGTKGYFFAEKQWLEGQNRAESDQEFYNRVNYDMATAKTELEELTNQSIVSFAFPFGNIGEDSQTYPTASQAVLKALKANYPQGMVQYFAGRGPSQTIYNSRQLLANRIEITDEWTASKLVNFLAGGSAKDLPFNDNFQNNQGWRERWGSLEQQPKQLQLKAKSDTTGAATVLDGSFGWRNYAFEVQASLPQGSSLELSVRGIDLNNYSSCSYSKEYVSAVQVVNGKRTSIEGKTVEQFDPRVVNRLSASIKDNQLSCYINGQAVATATLLDPPSSGGIGVSVWDPKDGTASALISNVSVREM